MENTGKIKTRKNYSMKNISSFSIFHACGKLEKRIAGRPKIFGKIINRKWVRPKTSNFLIIKFSMTF